MQVLDAQVDWREDVANDPKLEVLIDGVPDRSEMRFEHDSERGLWYADHEGYAEFFKWSGPENEGGYGGRNYTITTVDGEEVTLRGPWSSRAGVLNKFGFGPCVSVRLATNPDVLDRGHTFSAGAVTLEAAKQAIDMAETASHLERVEKFSGNEPYWVPKRNGGES